MKTTEGHLPAVGNEPQIYFRRWEPESEPKAAIVLVHGLAEHCGRYEGFADHFTSGGYSVCAIDLPGHGQSEGRKGHIKRFSNFFEAVSRLLTQVKQWYPTCPKVLVGHSMGGLISASFLLQREAEFAACVLSGPAVESPVRPSGFLLFLNRIFSFVAPTMGQLKLDSSGVSRDPEVVRKYDEDPLVYRGKVSARMVAELFKAMDALVPAANRISIPLQVLHGGEDAMTAVAGSRALVEAVGSSTKALRVYDGLFHEIFNEPERVQVLTEMRDWLDERLREGADTPRNE